MSAGPGSTRQGAGLVDLVVHSLESSWSGAVLHGVEEAAYEAGLEVVVSAGLTRTRPAGRNAAGWTSWWPGFVRSPVQSGRVDAVPVRLARPAPHPVRDDRPRARTAAGVVSVGAANWHGGVTATEHLLSLGHERIAVIAGHRHKMCSSARVAGYRSALAAAGVPTAPSTSATAASTRPWPAPPDARTPRPARAAHGGLRLLRPDGARRLRGPGGTAVERPGRHQRGRLRRPARGPLGDSGADHDPAAAVGDGGHGAAAAGPADGRGPAGGDADGVVDAVGGAGEHGHAGTPRPRTARSSARASSASGTVSRARTSGPAPASASIRGRWNRSSSATLSPYRPRYSEPSASMAPYGPTDAATQSGERTPFSFPFSSPCPSPSPSPRPAGPPRGRVRH
jgi:hypothetical protein